MTSRRRLVPTATLAPLALLVTVVVAGCDGESEATGETGWTAPVIVGRPATPLAVAIGDDGAALVVWSADPDGRDGEKPASLWASPVDPGGGPATPTRIDTDEAPFGRDARLAMDGTGGARVVWAARYDGHETLWENRLVDGRWEGSRLLVPGIVPAGCGGGLCDATGVALAMNRDGVGAVVWLDADDDVMWARTFDGDGWDDATIIGEGDRTDPGSVHSSLYLPRAGVSASGEVFAAWPVAVDELHVRRHVPGAGWSELEIIALTEGQTLFAGTVLTVSAGGEAVAGMNTGAGATYARFSPATGWSTLEPLPGSEPARYLGATFAMQDDGATDAAWISLAGSVWGSRHRPGTGWSTPVLLDASDEDPREGEVPAIAVDGRGGALVLWSQGDVQPTMFANDFDGARWGGAHLVDGTSRLRMHSPHVAMNPSGRAVAAWLMHGDNAYNQGLRASLRP